MQVELGPALQLCRERREAAWLANAEENEKRDVETEKDQDVYAKATKTYAMSVFLYICLKLWVEK